jgi:hypothetical protein
MDLGMAETVDNALLLEVLKEVRQEMRDQRALLMQSIDYGRSFERHVGTQLLAISQRIDEVKDDLERTIKSELMGLIGDLEVGGRRG